VGEGSIAIQLIQTLVANERLGRSAAGHGGSNGRRASSP
jgi:hypothetical protein